ncbi:54S ribosomal protein L6, mitochondrial-like [Teratosphaeria destructans]|uniref:54S ribosomal protein L6, mitochondrial-like n=1 Tax=Teratosphaeria destructans TaxID=418781 RepID=A0A9W7SSN6_9PEZI|nr:54S ribosomal protein L6, mitochondrial-like [Teratosphaeria destructans]
MAASRCWRPSIALRVVFTSSKSNSNGFIPAFLVPACAHQQSTHFSTTRTCHSKIGRAPLSVPPEVKFTVIPKAQQSRSISSADRGSTVHIEGPRGKMSVDMPPYMTIEGSDEGRMQTVRILDKGVRAQREMWGTVRAYLQNHILGVSEGHTAILRLVGVGYRATIENSAATKQPGYPGQKFVSLKVGYSHPIELGVPEGVTASTPQPTRILLEGANKEVVMQFAAKIREWRVPEPYKGKGIFVNDETIKLKAKKIK